MPGYIVTPDTGPGPAGGTLLRVKFGDPADNDQLVQDAYAAIDSLVADGSLQGGHLALVNGPASLPVAAVLAHRLGHLYGAVAFFDPKLAAYVVSIAHGNGYRVGDLIPNA